jgi:hypothetical protein
MRGQEEHGGSLFSSVSIQESMAASQPRRLVRRLADQVLDGHNPMCDEAG